MITPCVYAYYRQCPPHSLSLSLRVFLVLAKMPLHMAHYRNGVAGGSRCHATRRVRVTPRWASQRKRCSKLTLRSPPCARRCLSVCVRVAVCVCGAGHEPREVVTKKMAARSGMGGRCPRGSSLTQRESRPRKSSATVGGAAVGGPWAPECPRHTRAVRARRGEGRAPGAG